MEKQGSIFGVEKKLNKKDMAETYEEILARAGKDKVEKPVEAVVETKVETPEVVIETPEVEVKVETPETKPEVEVETPEKSLIEILAEKAGKKPEVKQEVVIPDEVKAQLEDLTNKLSKYETDPFHKAVSLGANPEQLAQIALEMQGVDYSKANYKDLMEKELISLGIEGDELAEQLETALAEYQELPAWKQKKEENELRGKYQASQKKGESEILKNLEVAFQERMKGVKTPEQVEQEINQVIQAEKGSIKELGTAILGTKMYGVEFTQAELNDILEKEYSPDRVTPYLDKDGNLQADKFIVDTFRLRNFDKMIQNEVEKEKAKFNKETSVTRGNVGSPPLTADKKTEQQKLAISYGFPDWHPIVKGK